MSGIRHVRGDATVPSVKGVKVDFGLGAVQLVQVERYVWVAT